MLKTPHCFINYLFVWARKRIELEYTMKTAEKNIRKIYTVSTLTREIKSLLEDRFPFLWITGEISNHAVPASGHSYFSLKDPAAVIACVMFKNQKQSLKFALENGLGIMGLARISLYEPRGSYQLIFEHLEPEGLGSLQKAFEQLKKKLAAQGIFDETHKKPLPFLPAKINVITSGTGAAVRDIIHVAGRRFPGCHLEILAVKVQGEFAGMEIAKAIETANTHNRSDLIILARGGGSMEDLWAFNSERVAMAIFESRIPVLTGIGHETDFTIADFVADHRAPTPSAAAELALPDQSALVHRINRLKASLVHAMTRKLNTFREKLVDLHLRLKSPKRIIDDFRLRTEDFENRMHRLVQTQISYYKERIFWLQKALAAKMPGLKIKEHQEQVGRLTASIELAMGNRLNEWKIKLRELNLKLEALNPRSILDRGYSVSRRVPSGKILMDARDAALEERIEIILSKGSLITRVEEKIHGQKNL